MLRLAFRRKEASKMVISTSSLESEMLHKVEVNFFNMISIAILNVICIKIMKRFPVRTIWK